MLLFSYANWDEIFQVCMGLCDNEPLNPDEGTEPPTNESTVVLDKKPDVA